MIVRRACDGSMFVCICPISVLALTAVWKNAADHAVDHTPQSATPKRTRSYLISRPHPLVIRWSNVPFLFPYYVIPGSRLRWFNNGTDFRLSLPSCMFNVPQSVFFSGSSLSIELAPRNAFS
ncbi:hypothetical protein FB451DRAFT_1293018 [Mycena latifolia]|nr:hypothetical protein FB451DRAFT_1293018 [Mycena latifolia]